jgi:hypothetical protein
VTPNQLALAGRLLLGDEWKRPLARLLGPHRPQGARETMDPRLPFRWASGERPIPGWVAPVLVRPLRDRAEDLSAQMDACEGVARELVGESAPMHPDDQAALDDLASGD